ncbi:MAG: TniQ family protein [Cycloclasticus sp.]|nr:TniQ family protein [Cycloclasticus sp.]
MIGIFPRPYHDELLYSVYARYKRMMGYKKDGDVLQDLFGSDKVKISPLWPDRLDLLLKNIPEGWCPSINDLIQHHTLVPVSSALPENKDQKEYQSENSNEFRIGGYTGLLESEHRLVGLAYCAECVREDYLKHGESYWRRSQNIFGVFVCTIHKLHLEYVDVPTRYGSVGLMLPPLKSATSESTRRAYKSAIRHFDRSGGMLPATSLMVMDYLLAHAQSLSIGTLSLRLSALKSWHKLQGFDNPVTNDVKKLLKGIERKEGKPKKKTATFSVKNLQQIIYYIDKESNLKAKRDKALILVGFFGTFRRSELVNIMVKHLKVVEEDLIITVPGTKTDQKGKSFTKPLLAMNNELCPIAALNAWLYESGIEDGAVFRGVSRWGSLQDNIIAAASVGPVLRDRASKAGLDEAQNLSSDSLRRSLAVAALKAENSFS